MVLFLLIPLYNFLERHCPQLCTWLRPVVLHVKETFNVTVLEEEIAELILWSILLAPVVALIAYKITGRRKKRAYQRKLDQKHKEIRENQAKLEQELATNDTAVKARRERIVSLKFRALVDALQKEDISAVEALDAYRAKALECQQRLNCCTEWIREAKERAVSLDKEYHGKAKPPLFGVPFSVKDNIHVKGYDVTLGLLKHVGKPVTEDAALIAYLKHLGAVPFVRTNMPQSLMSYVCSNVVFGTTGNPWDPTRTPGGSSGGESALVAAGGSAFGVGTDAAGSLRIPAAFCGLFTLKATSDRLTTTGNATSAKGNGRLRSCVGFITRDLDALQQLLKLTFIPEYFNRVPSTMVPLPFGTIAVPDKLRVGFYLNDGWMKAIPAATRAVEEAVNSLRTRGFDVVEFEVPDPLQAWKNMQRIIYSDNGAAMRNNVFKDEQTDKYVAHQAKILYVPIVVRRVLSVIIGKFWPRAGIILGSYVRSLSDLLEVHASIDTYKQHFIDELKKARIDVLVCPAFPFPAIPHEFVSKVSVAGFATGIYNLLDLPVGVVPWTTVSDDDQRKFETTYPRKDNFDKEMHKALKQSSSGAPPVGLPVGLQVVALPYREEVVLRMMQTLDEVRSKKDN